LAVQRPVREINHPLHCSAEVKDKWNLYLHYPSMSSLYARRQIKLQLPEDGASGFLQDAGAHLPDYAVPQRMILHLDI